MDYSPTTSSGFAQAKMVQCSFGANYSIDSALYNLTFNYTPSQAVTSAIGGSVKLFNKTFTTTLAVNSNNINGCVQTNLFNTDIPGYINFTTLVTASNISTSMVFNFTEDYRMSLTLLSETLNNYIYNGYALVLGANKTYNSTKLVYDAMNATKYSKCVSNKSSYSDCSVVITIYEQAKSDFVAADANRTTQLGIYGYQIKSIYTGTNMEGSTLFIVKKAEFSATPNDVLNLAALTIKFNLYLDTDTYNDVNIQVDFQSQTKLLASLQSYAFNLLKQKYA